MRFEGGPGVERESMEFDVLVVGAGPSRLSAAIRLRQLCPEYDQDGKEPTQDPFN